MKPLIIFYDEPCVLCNYWVQKLCRWDKEDQLRFSSLDSALFLGFAKERKLDLNQIDSIVVWDQQYSFALEAEGVFMVIKRLGGVWRLLLPFSFLPIVLTNPYQDNPKELTVWTGTDYEGCKRTRKSTSGGTVMWGYHKIKSWSSTQSIVALSSGEAEYYGMVKGASVALGLQSVWNDF